MVLRCHGSKHSLLFLACCQKAKCYHNPSWHHFRNINLLLQDITHRKFSEFLVKVLIKCPKCWVSSVLFAQSFN